MENTIKDQIIDFYNDELFQKINAYYGKKTLFNILKIERNEKRHSAFLAWLLDIKGSHGLGEEPFRRFMRLLSKQDDKYNNPFLYGNYRIANMEVETERPAKIKNCKTRYVDVDMEFGFTVNKVDEPVFVHIILENKVYTEEHDEQTDFYCKWAFEEQEISKKNKWIIGVFLSPELTEKCAGDTDDFEYVKITYDDILKYVIEPLLAQEMPAETRVILSDYVINLCQPWKVKNDDDKKASTDKDTILAMSRESKENFDSLYKKFKDLMDSALFANCYDDKRILKKEKEEALKRVFQSDFEIIKSNTENGIELLKSLWTANEMLITMVFDTVFEKNYTSEDEETSEQYGEAVSVLLNLKSSNRNTSKYLVYAKNGGLMNEKEKPTPFMSVASYYIFKAWLLDHPRASLKVLRDAFPVAECAKHYLETYQ